jgi:hypothetical protein
MGLVAFYPITAWLIPDNALGGTGAVMKIYGAAVVGLAPSFQGQAAATGSPAILRGRGRRKVVDCIPFLESGAAAGCQLFPFVEPAEGI